MTFLLIWVRRHCGVRFPTHLQILLSFPVRMNSKSHPSIPHQHNPSISTLTHLSSPPPARSPPRSPLRIDTPEPSALAFASTSTHVFASRSIPPSACSILLEKAAESAPCIRCGPRRRGFHVHPPPSGSVLTEPGGKVKQVPAAALGELDPGIRVGVDE